MQIHQTWATGTDITHRKVNSSMTGGFYNHYDDPDEFWDDEPLTRPLAGYTPSSGQYEHRINSQNPPSPKNSTRASENSSKASTQHGASKPSVADSELDGVIGTWNLDGSPFISMRVDRALIPIEVNVEGMWSQRFGHARYEEELAKTVSHVVIGCRA